MCLLVLLGMFLTSCNTQKYLQEVPYRFKYNDVIIRDNLGIEDKKKIATEEYEYEENLSDKEIFLKEKYAIGLHVLPKDITNYKFYEIIDNWIETPYAKKGIGEDGLNMAAFAQLLYKEAYKQNIPPNALGIFNSKNVELFVGRKYLEEGDLIFFRYNKDNPVSDVGIYLKNGFILASTPSTGLAVFNFNTTYFQLRYLCAGRLENKRK